MKTVIKIMGGLGNQMFQYAYGRSCELSGKKVIFDTSFFNQGNTKPDTARDFKLNIFNIETKAVFSNKKNRITDFLGRIKRLLRSTTEGYYQNEKYFNNIDAVIRKEFTLKNSMSEEGMKWQEKIIASENSVSIHIRRGDYVQDPKTSAFHGACNVEYYIKALEKITEILKMKNMEIFVFSDDILWAKENLDFPHQMYFVSDPRIADYEEMWLMSLCKHNVIANSTFSWWGAWLNNNPNKIVVGPKQWFNGKTSEELGILPKEWIKF